MKPEGVDRAVLETFARLEKEDSGGAWNSFYHEVVTAANGDPNVAEAICRNLRRRKLLKGQGRGRMAAYYLTDAGKQALAAT